MDQDDGAAREPGAAGGVEARARQEHHEAGEQRQLCAARAERVDAGPQAQ